MNLRPLILLLTSLFHKKDDHKAKRIAIIEFINRIKDAVNNPIADLIAKAIPGRTDDKILDYIRKAIPVILKSFELSNNGFNAQMAIPEAVRLMNTFAVEDRAKLYKKLSGGLYASMTGMPEDKAIEEIQKEYHGTV